MLPEYRSQLLSLSPGEMARYLHASFPSLDFLSVTEICFVTGVFPNDIYLLNYIDKFLDAMSHVSGGRFDPRQHRHQRMKVPSHLIRSDVEGVRTTCGAYMLRNAQPASADATVSQRLRLD